MPTICGECKGFLIGELALIITREGIGGVVNCGWYREGILMRPGTTIGIVKPAVDKQP